MQFYGISFGEKILFIERNTIKLYVQVISGFHRALLQSIAFISRLNALNYTKLRGQNLRCIKP